MRIYPGDDGVTVCACDVPEDAAEPIDNRRTVAETVTDAVVTIDADSTIRRANSATEDVFGYHPAALVGESIDLLIPDGLTDRNQDGIDLVEALIEHRASWLKLLNVRERDDDVSFEVLVSDPPLLSMISAAGGRFVETVIAEGDLQVRVQLPHDVDARELLDAVRNGYGGTKLVSKQQVAAAEMETQPSGPVALDELTDRRLEVLRTAYHAGYFAWPRETSGEDVADLLDISPPTFSQHLRAAEQSVFRMLFEGTESG